MPNIDEKVVRVQFDNKEFERGIKVSLESLANLKKSISGVNDVNTKGLEKSVNSVDFSPILKQIDQISSRFTTNGIIAMEILKNIATTAYNTGLQIAKSLTIEPITQGFSEYELKINSIQTILGNTSQNGTTLDDVEIALNNLNDYADKTIYNFANMTDAIGRFTTAGIGLDTAVASIKGLANVGALQGANPQQVANAMYQMSQAMSSGTVRLQDWMSLENSSMAGTQFQEALMRTARTHGIAIDQMIEDAGSFRYTLEQNWLTAEIFTETLDQFTGDMTDADLAAKGYTEDQIAYIQDLAKKANDAATVLKTFTAWLGSLKEAIASGWASSFEIIIGGFDEAQELWTNVSDTLGGIVGVATAARNALLLDWAAMGGRQELIDGVAAAFENLQMVVAPIKKAFEDIFPPITAEQLYNISAGISAVIKSLKPTENQLETIEILATGVFSVLKIFVNNLGNYVKYAAVLINGLKPLFDWTLKVALAMAQLITKLAIILTESNSLDEVLVHVEKGLYSFASAIVYVLDTIIDVDRGVEIIQNLKDSLSDLFKVGNTSDADKIKNFMDSFMSVLNFIGNGLKGGFNKLISFFELINWDTVSFTMLSGSLSTAFIMIGKAILDFMGSAKKGVDLFKDLSDVLQAISGVFDALELELKSKIFINIAIAIGILAASFLLLSFIDINQLMLIAAIMSGVVYVLSQLLGTMTSLFGALNTKGAAILVVALIAIAGAIMTLAIAIGILALIPMDMLGRGLLALAAILGMIVLFSKFIGRYATDIIAFSIGMTYMAKAIQTLALAVAILSVIDEEKIGQGLGSVISLLSIITLMSVVLDKTNANLPTIGAGLMLVALGIGMLVSSVLLLGLIPYKILHQGLTSIALIMAGLMIFVYVLNGVKTQMLSISAAVLILAFSLTQLSIGILAIGFIPWSAIQTALAVLGIILGGLIVVSYALWPVIHIFAIFVAGLFVLQIGLFLGGMMFIWFLNTLLNFIVKMAAISVGLATIAAGMIAGLNVFAQGIIDNETLLKNALISVVNILGAGLNQLIIIAGDALAVLGITIIIAVVKLLEALYTAMPTVSFLIVGLVTNLLLGLAVGVPGMVLAAMAFIVAFVDGLAIAIEENKLGIAQAAAKLIEELVEALAYALFAFTETFVADLAEWWGNAISDWWNKVIGNDAYFKDKEIAANVDGDITLTYTDLIVNSTQAEQDAATNNEIVQDAIEDPEGYQAAAGTNIDAYKDAMATFQLTDVTTNLNADLQGMFAGSGDIASQYGSETTGLFADSMLTDLFGVTNAATEVGNTATEGVADGVSDLPAQGTNAVNSFNNNLYAGGNSAYSAGYYIGNQAAQGTKNALEIRSPSRVMKAIAENMDNTLADTAIKNAHVVNTAMIFVAAQMANTLKSNLDKNTSSFSLSPILSVDTSQVNTDQFDNTFTNLSNRTNDVMSSLNVEEHVTIHHTFDTLTIEGVDNEGEFVQTAEFTMQDIVKSMRREVRR